MFKNILEKRKRFTIPMAVATASKSRFHEINNIIQFFLEFFFFSGENEKNKSQKPTASWRKLWPEKRDKWWLVGLWIVTDEMQPKL